MTKEHCEDHTNCMVKVTQEVTEIRDDVKWIKKIANTALIAFLSTGLLGALSIWFWKGLHSAIAGGN